jgi:ADP-ribose pyrophosphatase YjhB (NUDIX family)
MLQQIVGLFRRKKEYRNPVPTVDIIIEIGNKIVLIERKHEPFGWAIPGGFVDYGECLEDAARREAKEETSLDVKLKFLLGVYSSPKRDPRRHTVSAVYVATARANPKLQTMRRTLASSR